MKNFKRWWNDGGDRLVRDILIIVCLFGIGFMLRSMMVKTF